MIRAGAAYEGHRQVDRSRVGAGHRFVRAARGASVAGILVAVVTPLARLEHAVTAARSLAVVRAGRSVERVPVLLPVVAVLHARLDESIPASGVPALRGAACGRSVLRTVV